MSLSIDEAVTLEKSRLLLVALTGLTLRLMEGWTQAATEMLGRETDQETIMIIAAVLSINSDRVLWSGLASSLHDIRNPLPPELLGGCNVSAIAEATGLNRETARRRVESLVAEDILIREGRSIRLRDGILQDPLVLTTLRSQLGIMRRATSQLLRAGILRQTRNH